MFCGEVGVCKLGELPDSCDPLNVDNVRASGAEIRTSKSVGSFQRQPPSEALVHATTSSRSLLSRPLKPAASSKQGPQVSSVAHITRLLADLNLVGHVKTTRVRSRCQVGLGRAALAKEDAEEAVSCRGGRCFSPLCSDCVTQTETLFHAFPCYRNLPILG